MSGSGFTSAELGWLVSNAGAAAYSEVEWRLDGGAFRADIPVAATEFDDGEVDLVYQVHPRTPWQPRAVLRIRRDHAARICVNRSHREDGLLIPVATHIHTRRSSNHLEVYSPIEMDVLVSAIGVGVPVEDGQHLAVLRHLADRFGISLAGLTWNDPPEEVN